MRLAPHSLALEVDRIIMGKQYKWGRILSACRVQFDFKSYLFISAYIGFCGSVVAIPFLLLFAPGGDVNVDVGERSLLIFLFTPVSGVLNGLFLGLLGYPLYRWISNKLKGDTYTGKIVELIRDDE